MQRFLHFTYPLAFFAPLATPILLLLPMLAIFTGKSPFVMDESSYLFLLAQVAGLASLQAIFFLAVGTKTWRAWQYYWGMFPAYILACTRIFFGKLEFSVSKKEGGSRVSGSSQLMAVKWQLLLLVLGIVASLRGLVLVKSGTVGISLYPSVAWMTLNNALLWGVVSPPLKKTLIELVRMIHLPRLYPLTVGRAAALSLVALISTSLTVGAYVLRYTPLSVQTLRIDDVDTLSHKRMQKNLIALEKRLSTGPEVQFETLLFFTIWGENTIADGERQFATEVAPLLDLAYEQNMVPVITWEPMYKGTPQTPKKEIVLHDIIDGKSDQYLIGWRNGLQQWMAAHPDYEVRIRLMHEMNAPITEYPWSHVSPAEYRELYEYIYTIISQVDGDLQWMLVFQNFTADAAWEQKRARDYERYIPKVPIDYIGIDGYSRPYLAGIDGPPGGEVTPRQVLPEAFFVHMRKRYPTAKLVISETSVPFMPETSEPIPYPPDSVVYRMTDQERAQWITDLEDYLLYLDETYDLYEVTWFNGNTDYHWSLFAPEEEETMNAFQSLTRTLQQHDIKVGLYPGE